MDPRERQDMQVVLVVTLSLAWVGQRLPNFNLSTANSMHDIAQYIYELELTHECHNIHSIQKEKNKIIPRPHPPSGYGFLLRN